MAIISSLVVDQGEVQDRPPPRISYRSLLTRSRSLFWAVFCAVSILLSVILDLLSPMVFGRAIDNLQSAMTWPQLIRQAALILAVKGAATIVYAGSEYLADFTAVRLVTNLRTRYYSNLLRQSSDFFTRFQAPDLVWRATGDLEIIAKVVNEAIPFVIRAGGLILIAIPLIFRVYRGMAIFLLVLLPLIIGLVFLMRLRTLKYGKQMQNSLTGLLQHLDETVYGMKTIRAYCLEKARSATFERLVQTHSEMVMRLIRVGSFFGPLTFLLVGVGFMLNMTYGVVLVSRDQLTLGQFVEVNGYMWQLMWPLTSLGGVIGHFRLAQIGFERLNEVLATEPPASSAPAHTDNAMMNQGGIVFDHVAVQYENQAEPILKDIDLVIKGGQVVAVAGRSGSGKSTMMRLILRNCSPSRGRVLIDQVSVHDHNLTYLRAKISYVTQEPFLFSGTIGDNIGLGNPHAHRVEVRRATEIAGLLNEIEAFPDGFNTLVGERGITLSGGQKQRLAIARAVLRNPQILILDDALSSVDARTEEQILARLLATGTDRTTIIISNHIRSIKNADRIYVLENGVICEQGSHSELMAYGGEYARWCETSHHGEPAC